HNALAECRSGEPERARREILERLADAAHRVQHAHRALHDVGEVPPADRLDLLLAGAGDVDGPAAERVGYRAVNYPERRADSGGQHLDEARLARGTLASDAVDLVGLDAHGDVVDGPNLAFDAEIVHLVVGLEAIDLEDVLGHRHAPIL